MNPLRRILLFATVLASAWCAGPRAAGAPEGSTVELPPLEVEEKVVAHPWLYAEAPGFEVLSRCTSETTREFLRAQNRIAQLFKLVVPDSLQLRLSAPVSVILSNRESTPTSAQELLAKSLAERPDVSGNKNETHSPTANAIRFMPNLRISDVDAYTVYAILDETRFDADRIEIAREHAYFLLTQRSPPLPDWYVAGVMGLFESLHFELDSLTISGVHWSSDEETERLRRDPMAPRTLLSFEEFFGDRPAPGTPEAEEFYRIWRAQATLLVRWALDPKNGSRRDALWSFVGHSSAEPSTEERFRSSFGWGYAEMRDRLSDYLPFALKGSFRLRPTQKITFLLPRIHDATQAEIGRLRGEWERLEVTEVKARHPEYADRYVEQAARTLQIVYSKGERDPRFLAVKGLFECDQGHDAEARPLLEAAMAAKVARPRIYAELARIRFVDTLNHRSLSETTFDVRQANAIFEPLRIGASQYPPLLTNYRLAAELWNRSTVSRSPGDVAWFDQGLNFFPNDVTLLYEAAILAMYRGNPAEAQTCIARGLRLARDDTTRQRFQELETRLESPPAEHP